MTSTRSTRRGSAAPSQQVDLWLCLLLGTLIAAFGSAASFDRAAYDAPFWLGPFLLWVAAIFTLIGIIGLGVSLGVRASGSDLPRTEAGTAPEDVPR